MKVTKGQIIAILGPSGSGKTTFLQIICGLQHSGCCQTAKIRLAGVTVKEAVQSGFVSLSFQTPVLMPWLTAAENVMLPLNLRNVVTTDGNLRWQAEKALACVQLADAKDKYPRALSSGMRSRVAVAQAMVSHSKILLLDEVFGTLDEPTRVDVDGQLRKLNDTEMNSTILMVTHSIDEALLLADRVVIFRKGLKNATESTVIDDVYVPFAIREPGTRSTKAFQDVKALIEEVFVREKWTR